MLDTINQVVSNQTVGLSEFGAELRKREIAYETIKERIAQDKDLSAVLNSPAYTDEQKKAITNGITQQVMVELGYKPTENVLIATTEPGRDGEQVKGFFSLETGKAYINDFYNNSNVDLLTTAGAETQRAIDAQNGSKFDQSKEYRDARSAYSQNFGSNIASYADFALYFTGQGSLSTAPNSLTNYSATTLTNNAEFKGLDKNLGDNLIWSQLSKDRAVLSSPFGMRQLPGQSTRPHNGTDITYKDANGNKITNATIFAAGDGEVVMSENRGASGNLIRIYHPDTGYTSEYLHASELLVKKGTIVKEGQPIMVEGGSGDKGLETYDKHLHFGIYTGEIYDKTKFVNPAPTNGDKPVNVGKYEKLEDTPYQQGLLK